MASNRKVQRLLNEFMDLLSEYASIENNLDHRNPFPLTVSQPEIDLIDCNPSATCQMDIVEPTIDKKENPSPGIIDQMDSILSNQANSGTKSSDQVNQAPTNEDPTGS
ncbi:hypothetical protein GOBAR_AA22608 [Gossypium barbadense]|uniref:Uncharacterized protein n=1 Tax=Gossypium barbadense TaxID=3634 RepID=A0A2P5X412_GOSBA|nr:hypothetical protein GOBAR_AA22608 [Gossypium barbadense]